jgi:hypothetical protein
MNSTSMCNSKEWRTTIYNTGKEEYKKQISTSTHKTQEATEKSKLHSLKNVTK